MTTSAPATPLASPGSAAGPAAALASQITRRRAPESGRDVDDEASVAPSPPTASSAMSRSSSRTRNRVTSCSARPSVGNVSDDSAGINDRTPRADVARIPRSRRIPRAEMRPSRSTPMGAPTRRSSGSPVEGAATPSRSSRPLSARPARGDADASVGPEALDASRTPPTSTASIPNAAPTSSGVGGRPAGEARTNSRRTASVSVARRADAARTGAPARGRTPTRAARPRPRSGPAARGSATPRGGAAARRLRLRTGPGLGHRPRLRPRRLPLNRPRGRPHGPRLDHWRRRVGGRGDEHGPLVSDGSPGHPIRADQRVRRRLPEQGRLEDLAWRVGTPRFAPHPHPVRGRHAPPPHATARDPSRERDPQPPQHDRTLAPNGDPVNVGGPGDPSADVAVRSTDATWGNRFVPCGPAPAAPRLPDSDRSPASRPPVSSPRSRSPRRARAPEGRARASRRTRGAIAARGRGRRTAPASRDPRGPTRSSCAPD